MILPPCLDGLALEDIFEPPHPGPEPGPPPFGHGSPVRLGDVPAGLVGQPAWVLAQSLLPSLGEREALDLVAFGTLWLDNHVLDDPKAALPGGTFRLNLPWYGPHVFYEVDPARLVFRDGDILVYDKESGPATVPVPHDSRNNLHAALERHTRLTLRAPHRLDAPTSGLVIMAANRLAASRIGVAFKKGQVRKRYLALSSGPLPGFSVTTVDAPISKQNGRLMAIQDGPGRPSRTRVSFLRAFGDRLLFLAEPETGRTHQIRLHLALLGYPIAGDRLYGGESADRLMLKASGLCFRHPGTGQTLTLGGPWP
ncbi:MAG: RluA family pseudouridine synthase [Deltaproteobacteria bacterium]|nr:RluA family pseudouridine synthase [Deltaproteobacteria bacterium]